MLCAADVKVQETLTGGLGLWGRAILSCPLWIVGETVQSDLISRHVVLVSRGPGWWGHPVFLARTYCPVSNLVKRTSCLVVQDTLSCCSLGQDILSCYPGHTVLSLTWSRGHPVLLSRTHCPVVHLVNRTSCLLVQDTLSCL